ncbi:MAG TPA: copper-binding protein [Verrucomicrobiae bacterium]|nr:copper-binding protein [Verrucomicrobiae bacterium]
MALSLLNRTRAKFAGKLNLRTGGLPGFLFLLLLVFCALGLFACNQAAKTHPLVGTVVEIQADEGYIVVDGREIPGFMQAMKMPYQLHDAAEYSKLAVGDEITADIVATDNGFELEHVVVVRQGHRPPAAARGGGASGG